MPRINKLYLYRSCRQFHGKFKVSNKEMSGAGSYGIRAVVNW